MYERYVLVLSESWALNYIFRLTNVLMFTTNYGKSVNRLVWETSVIVRFIQ